MSVICMCRKDFKYKFTDSTCKETWNNPKKCKILHVVFPVIIAHAGTVKGFLIAEKCSALLECNLMLLIRLNKVQLRAWLI